MQIKIIKTHLPSFYLLKMLGQKQKPISQYESHSKYSPKINMEPENHPFEKEHHLPNVLFLGFMLILGELPCWFLGSLFFRKGKFNMEPAKAPSWGFKIVSFCRGKNHQFLKQIQGK